jgi:hypothetical protein
VLCPEMTMLAVAAVMSIVLLFSLLPIDHVMT